MSRKEGNRRLFRRAVPVLAVIVVASVWVAWLAAAVIDSRSFPIDGQYWISLPAVPDPPVANAEQLLSYGPFDQVGHFKNASDQTYWWNGTTCQLCDNLPAIGNCVAGVDPDAAGTCTTNCFCVTPGEGYQVTVSGTPKVWQISGQDGLTVYSFDGPGSSFSGSNLISLPIGIQPADAKALIDDINFVSGNQVVNVRRFLTNSDGVEVYDGLSGVAWPLVAGEGYIVQVNSDFDYSPPQDENDLNRACVGENVAGTVQLPPDCNYYSRQDLHMIIDGLPSGTVVHIGGIHGNFTAIARSGSRATTSTESFTSQLDLHVTGTGALSGVDCTLSMTGVTVEVESKPVNNGAPVQIFDTEMKALNGSLTSDTTCNLFDSLTIEAGADNGLPASPGRVELRQRADGTFGVASTFDITNAISFVGKAGSPLDGMSGTTIGHVQMATNAPFGSTSNTVPALSRWGWITAAGLLLVGLGWFVLRRGAGFLAG